LGVAVKRILGHVFTKIDVTVSLFIIDTKTSIAYQEQVKVIAYIEDEGEDVIKKILEHPKAMKKKYPASFLK
jgi:hypothetical protein